MSVHPITRPPDAQAAHLRDAFGRAAASTWVITGSGERGPVGFTAISVVSVSLAPPLLSFNIAKDSSSLVTIAHTGRAALHLLAEDQEPIALRFARDRTRRFVDDEAWTYDDHGLPSVRGVASRLITRIHDLVDAGDSFVAIARVEHATTHDRQPLVHRAGAYAPVAASVQTPLTATPGA
ncbi:flavin reductase family protein [Ornithinimicrobium faecis]|uniref:Flavin reductase family protein n=1 Tax=Ornithinimicrobium faecis TaxID=2934158 RepID=A0ABY4YXG9_9MICO|nr:MULTISPECIES: flavin reductase family protein [unclassified Ornithinimicrobium]USQ81434.1 flavin reductase family protein [Ornithinimicrobium sp. HY1793]